jgi:protein SCO1
VKKLAYARWIVILAVAAGCAVPLGVLLFATRPSLSASPASDQDALPVGSIVAPPRATPRFGLIGENGRPTSLAAFRGRWLVLAPAMTLCHEVCPMTTAALIELTDALRRVGLARKVAVAEVTVDPWRDSPARLRAYRRLCGSNFSLLTGTQAQIRAIWRFFGVYYERVPQGNPPDIDWMTGKPETFDVQHTDALFVLDPQGRERIVEEGMAQVARPMPRALRALLDAEGLRDLAHPQFPWSASEVLADLARLTGWHRLRTAGGWTRANGKDSRNSHPRQNSATSATRHRGALARFQLNGSPSAIAALRLQAGRLLGNFGALRARLRSLRGHPVVLNAWASWCPPCEAEMPMFDRLAAVAGGEVAFLGADTDDTAGAATAFLAAHPLAYPSYEVSLGSLNQLAPVEGTPTTLFIDPRGNLVHVHPGQYEDARALESDIQRYALGR